MALTSYVSDQIWLCTYPIRLAGTKFEARMTTIRLTSGLVMLHSPCHITASIAEEISAIGSVGHIVVPGNFHHLHASSAQIAFPSASTWICPGIERKRPDLKYDGVLGDVAPAGWAGEIDQVLVQGTRIMREVAMYHRASQTLILVDLIENFTDATPNTGGALKLWFKYVLRMWGKPGPAPEYRMGGNDQVSLAKSLRRILAWDFRQIVLSHGDLIDQDAHEVAAAAWSKILGFDDFSARGA
ncbi:hypothetical protein BA190_08455 [Labrys sp. WJW]|uniref:DUF4336 domain-containing protein n=1 Tax=Labrys sp. WJW TaxID=1737983 RepID=UPI00082F6867|nr:DUF4336 domain-containing protein [Labrys sp. WJW]OCC05442.1 hypothetical protein BA190_08455 [Labrys sp. WJW]